MDCRIFFVLMISILYIHASPYLHRMSKRERFCGRRLVEAMSLACAGRYNGPDKKSLGYGYNNDEDNKVDNSLETLPLLERYLATQRGDELIPYRYRRGIVEECCFKPCSLNDLRLYCAPEEEK